MENQTIEVSMIIRDEEAMLGRALESIKGVDSVTIIDTGSIDNTRDVVKKFKDSVKGITEVKYYENEYKWNKHFAEARNFSKSKCTKDWLLILDGDEVLDSSVKDLRLVINAANALKKDFVYFQVKAKKKNGMENSSIRAFRNIPEIKWKGAAHNYLVSTKGKNSKTSYISDLKLGFYYSPTHAAYPKRTLEILQNAVKKDPKLIREKFYLAREYAHFGYHVMALYWIDEYLKTAHWRDEIAEAHLQKARCLWLLRKAEPARVACMYAIMTNPDFKGAMLFMAKMNHEPRKSLWTNYAKYAKNTNVIFVKD